MRLENEERSQNIEDRRGQRSRSSGSFSVGRGKGGILSLLIVLVGAYYGVDLSGVMGFDSNSSYQTQSSRLTDREEKELDELAGKVLNTTERAWSDYFRKNGMVYKAPKLVIYYDNIDSACGTGQSAMGPFYCPADEKIYLDLSFYDDMRKQLKAEGDFAFAYVIAHEVGHHVQNRLGISQRTQQAQRQARSQAEANQISVRVELQADCFAGVWGYQMQQEDKLDVGDVEEAFNAAQAVGDDRLQKNSRGYAVPDSFTHGSSAQRLAAFRKGLQSGNPSVCQL